MTCCRHTYHFTALVACFLTMLVPAHAQIHSFTATYTGTAQITGPDAHGYLHVTSTLHDPMASFGLTEALFKQTVYVFSNPNLIKGNSTFQTMGGVGADKLFTRYSGTGTPVDPTHGIDVTFIQGRFQFTGGTGAWIDAHGGGTWIGEANVVTGAVTVTFTGLIVPEAREYLYLPLDPPAAQGHDANWNGINNEGEIGGGFVDAGTGLLTAALYQNGIFTPVSIPNSTLSYLSAVNDHGSAIGAYFDQTYLAHSFLRAKKRQYRLLARCRGRRQHLR